MGYTGRDGMLSTAAKQVSARSVNGEKECPIPGEEISSPCLGAEWVRIFICPTTLPSGRGSLPPSTLVPSGR